MSNVGGGSESSRSFNIRLEWELQNLQLRFAGLEEIIDNLQVRVANLEKPVVSSKSIVLNIAGAVFTNQPRPSA